MDLHRLLEVLSAPDTNVVSALAILSVASLGTLAMVLAAGAGGERRRGAHALLAAGALYAVANVAAFVGTLSADRFAIFEPIYLWSVAVAAPLAVVALALALARRRAPWPALAGFGLWAAALAAAHLWVVAQASASV